MIWKKWARFCDDLLLCLPSNRPLDNGLGTNCLFREVISGSSVREWRSETRNWGKPVKVRSRSRLMLWATAAQLCAGPLRDCMEHAWELPHSGARQWSLPKTRHLEMQTAGWLAESCMLGSNWKTEGGNELIRTEWGMNEWWMHDEIQWSVQGNVWVSPARITTPKAAWEYECALSCANTWKEMQTQPECSHAGRWTFEKTANLFTTNYLQFNDAASHMLFMVRKQYLWFYVNLPRSPRDADMAWPGL